MTDSTHRGTETASEAADTDLQASGIRVDADRAAAQDTILTADALAFLADLHRRFDVTRQARLSDRRARQARFDARELPDFRDDTAAIRAGDWRVAPIPAALQDRRVEITGSVDPKMVINALNSGANCYMADFEDSTSPTWANLIAGQECLRKAVAGTLEHLA
jgi:malate synthase